MRHDLSGRPFDARHANAALKVRPNKTDRNDAAGLAQIIRTGWFKQVRIKSRISYELRSLLAAREVLVRSRVKIENEIRGLLRTFGILFGKAVGGFASRTDQIGAGELDASPMMRTVISSLARARAAMLERIKALDRQVLAAARADTTVRLFMSVPGVGPITALSVASAFDDASRFKRSSSAGAYLGLTPKRYESGEMSRNGRISKRRQDMSSLRSSAMLNATADTSQCSPIVKNEAVSRLDAFPPGLSTHTRGGLISDRRLRGPMNNPIAKHGTG